MMHEQVERQVDFMITTMDRYDLLGLLIESIKIHYPNAFVTVADQSKHYDEDFYARFSNTKVHRLDYDCGLSYARNILMNFTKKPYKLLLEDDFLFTPKTTVENLLELCAQKGNRFVVGGEVRLDKAPVPFEFYLVREKDVLKQVPDGDNWEIHNDIKYKYTGCCLNFALFHESIFEEILWDPQLKLREHQDFFYRLSIDTDFGVIFTPDVRIVDNKYAAPQRKDYEGLKGRDEFMVMMMQKHGLKKIKYLKGHVIELEGDKVFRSYEKSDYDLNPHPKKEIKNLTVNI